MQSIAIEIAYCKSKIYTACVDPQQGFKNKARGMVMLKIEIHPIGVIRAYTNIFIHVGTVLQPINR